MNNLYNFGIRAYGLGIAIAGLVNPKARLWHKGRVALFERLATKIDTRGERVWVHVASLGEFEQARPIIEELKRVRPEVKVVVTFFSPSGYEIRKNYPKADCVEYLPEDTPESVSRFLDIVKPSVALFIKYEFWLNYLEELRRREIPTLLASAIFRRDSVFFRPYGKAWRKALGTYETMFVQNDKSKELLNELGYQRVVVAGDSRFDRVREIAQQAKEIETIERFKGRSRLFVAGSTWERDEELIIDAMAKNRDIKFLIAPHEIGDDRVQRLMDRCNAKAIRYTDIRANDDLADYQLLILDTMGMLSSVYRYADWAYIGGGFGAGIHNILEPAVYGIALTFGPRYHKFQEAHDLIGLGVAQSVRNKAELRDRIAHLKRDSFSESSIRAKALKYIDDNCGATPLIVEHILNLL